MSASSAELIARRHAGLRGNAMGGLVMVLIEYALGISANLYSTLPSADKGKPLFAALGAAVGNGPLLISLHALLGTLLLFTALAVVVRSSRMRERRLIAISAGALLATLVAWLSGSSFIGNQRNGASLAMALAAAVAILCYALLVLLLGARSQRAGGKSRHATRPDTTG